MDKESEFIVRLPRLLEVTSQSHDGGGMPGAPAAGGQRRVLVVDDNEDAAQTLAELLRMLGSEAEVAHDGASALAAVRAFSPDVMLLDIGLPDMNGYDVARQLRAMSDVRQPHLIALTGWGQDQDKQNAAEAGFDEHWTKPVDPSRLQQLTG